MSEHTEFLSLNEDELLIEIGLALDKDSLDAFPKPIAILKQRAEKFLIVQKKEYQDLICNSKKIQALASEGFTTELVAAVIGLIESITIGAAVSPIAILLCKKGIANFCSVHWGETK